MASLARIQEFVEQTNSTTSRNEKIEIVKQFADLKDFFKFHYDDLVTYGVTSKACAKHTESYNHLGIFYNDSLETLMILLKKFVARELTGHAAIETLNCYKSIHVKYEKLIDNIIDKNLKNRLGSKDINSAFSKLIPEFSIALAYPFSDGNNPKLINSGNWYVSTKLDGVRLIAHKTGNEVRFFSRSGNEYLTLEAYKTEIINNVAIENCIIDGELIFETQDGSDDFSEVMSQVTKKNYQVNNLTYMVFDILTHEEFFSLESKEILSDRYKRFSAITESSKIKILTQYKYSESIFKQLLVEYNEKNWEGFIFRKDTVYKGKRSKDILKWKEFFDAEYKVIGVEYDTKQMLVDGVNTEVNCLANVIIEHAGNKVSVGSGFSDAQRLQYNDNIIGQTITVQYKKESVDKTGKLSLQFPTFKILHGKERTT